MFLLNRLFPLIVVGATTVISACDSNDLGQCDVPFSTEDLIVGDGSEAVIGRNIRVDYTGHFCDSDAADLKGEVFDATGDGPAFQFVLGAGQVIDGWDEGIPGMKVGGRRRLTIPPDMAYGTSGNGAIPPNATLVFEVELLEVR